MRRRLMAVVRLRESVATSQLPELERGQDTEKKRRRKRAKKAKAKTREAGRFVAQLRETEVSRRGSSYEVTLLREGPGNAQDRNYYTREALQKAVSDGLFEGAQCYADHPTPSEERERPERSVRHLIGHFREARFVDGKQAEVRAKFQPVTGEGYEWVTSLIESALQSPADRPLIGLSIEGYGHAPDQKEIGGKTYNLVREIARLGSVDLVTRAGAGGGFIRRLSESLAGIRKATGEREAMDARTMRKRVRQAVKRFEAASAHGDPDTLAEAVQLLRDVAHAKIDKATGSRKVRESVRTVPVEDTAKLEKLEQRARKAEKQQRRAESEAATLKRASQARALLVEAQVPADIAQVWFDELAEQPNKQAMRRVLERRQADRLSALAELRESLGMDRVEGVPRRDVIAPAAPPGRTLLARMGIDHDGLEAT